MKYSNSFKNVIHASFLYTTYWKEVKTVAPNEEIQYIAIYLKTVPKYLPQLQPICFPGFLFSRAKNKCLFIFFQQLDVDTFQGWGRKVVLPK